MNSKKMYFVMLGSIGLIIVAIFATLYFGNSVLSKKSDQLVELKLEDELLEQEQSSLTQASKDIEQYADLEEISKSVVPQDKDQARAVREIVKIAAQSGITLSSIAFPSSTLGSAPPPTTQPSDDSGGESSTPAPPPISQAAPVQGLNGVYSLEITIIPDSTHKVTYYQFLDFLERLENNRRTAQVTSVKATPTTFNEDNPLIDFTLTINIFVKP